MSQEIVELSYAKYAQYYSKKNWWCNAPLWNSLTDTDKEFWTSFIKDIQANYGLTIRIPNSHPPFKTVNEKIV